MTDCLSISNKLLRIKDLSSNSKLIYSRIKEFEPDICRMITAEFIEELGISRIQYHTAIKELISKKYVEELPYRGLKIIKEVETPAEENQIKQKKTKDK